MKLDIKVFKALSSPTRIKIVRNLQRRRMTQSELASVLNMHVSTVKEHLDLLENADLIELNEEGHKWKYYSLSREGKNLFSPYQTEIRIILPVSLGLIFLGIWNSLREITNIGIGTIAEKSTATQAIEGTREISNGAVTYISQFPTISILLIIIGVFLLGIIIGLKLKRWY